MKQDAMDALIEKALEMGALAGKVIQTHQIVFDPRSYLKCRFGCNRWGKYWTCPPHIGVSEAEFEKAFACYTHGLVIQTADPSKGQEIAVALEKEAMLRYGHDFAFALALCTACDQCAYPEPCVHPELARPTMDAFGVDVGKTMEKLGFKVDFDPKGNLIPAWYSMVLLD